MYVELKKISSIYFHIIVDKKNNNFSLIYINNDNQILDDLVGATM